MIVSKYIHPFKEPNYNKRLVQSMIVVLILSISAYNISGVESNLLINMGGRDRFAKVQQDWTNIQAKPDDSTRRLTITHDFALLNPMDMFLLTAQGSKGELDQISAFVDGEIAASPEKWRAIQAKFRDDPLNKLADQRASELTAAKQLGAMPLPAPTPAAPSGSAPANSAALPASDASKTNSATSTVTSAATADAMAKRLLRQDEAKEAETAQVLEERKSALEQLNAEFQHKEPYLSQGERGASQAALDEARQAVAILEGALTELRRKVEADRLNLKRAS
jgi:hypothetical protein